MAIVLPDGIFGNETEGYVRNWIFQNTKIIAIIDVPLETFLPHTGTKTSILILQKNKSDQKYPIFLSIAEYCGHDRRGKEIEKDDILKIAKNFYKWKTKNKIESLQPITLPPEITPITPISEPESKNKGS